MENELFNIFNNINRWLEFAEKKNTYIFSFFSLIIIFTPFIGKLTSLNLLIKISICIFYLIYIVTITITIISLFPKTDILKDEIENGKNKKIYDKDNLLFYGDISKYSQKEYIEALKNKYNIDVGKNIFAYNLVEQIIINSIITHKKLSCFKITSILTITALIEFAICFGINLLFIEGI